jgi:hypothetical protein
MYLNNPHLFRYCLSNVLYGSKTVFNRLNKTLYRLSSKNPYFQNPRCHLFRCHLAQLDRLLCRHVCHEKCLQVFMANTDAKKASCPECRGTIRDPKHYLFIAENQFQNSDSSDDDAYRGKPYNTPAKDPTNQATRDRPSKDPPSGSSSLGSSIVVVQPLFPMW